MHTIGFKKNASLKNIIYFGNSIPSLEIVKLIILKKSQGIMSCITPFELIRVNVTASLFHFQLFMLQPLQLIPALPGTIFYSTSTAIKPP